MNVLEWNECSVNVRWMFAEQSRENECSWMIKNVRKIPLTTSHIVFKYTVKSHVPFWNVLERRWTFAMLLFFGLRWRSFTFSVHVSVLKCS